MMTKNHTTEYKKGLRARLKALKKNAGFTMVELIVCFAILGIFMVSAAQLISSTAFIYQDAKATANSQQVADILMNKVTGEIKNAQSNPVIATMPDGSNSIKFTNSDGVPILISKNDNVGKDPYDLLNIEYNPGTEGKDHVNWRYDKKVYKGFHITNMTFKQDASKYEDNVYIVTISVKNDKEGAEYEMTSLVKCYRIKN